MSEIRIPSLNRVLLAGRLTRDPELRYTPNGKAVCRFSLAVNRRHKDQSGRWVDDPTYINIVAWQEAAEEANRRLKKGSPVLVEGRLESRAWENDAGQKKTLFEIRADNLDFLEKAGPDKTDQP
jgi:single-strand DNA-binding protein